MTTPTRPRSTAVNVFLRPSGTEDNFLRLTIVTDRLGIPVPPPGIPAGALDTYNTLADNFAAGVLAGTVTDSRGRKLDYEFGPARAVRDVNDTTPVRPARPAGAALTPAARAVLTTFRAAVDAGNHVPLASLRRDTSLTFSEFNAGMNELRRAGILSLSGPDRYLTPADRAAAIIGTGPDDILTHASAR